METENKDKALIENILPVCMYLCSVLDCQHGRSLKLCAVYQQ